MRMRLKGINRSVRRPADGTVKTLGENAIQKLENENKIANRITSRSTADHR